MLVIIQGVLLVIIHDILLVIIQDVFRSIVLNESAIGIVKDIKYVSCELKNQSHSFPPGFLKLGDGAVTTLFYVTYIQKLLRRTYKKECVRLTFRR